MSTPRTTVAIAAAPGGPARFAAGGDARVVEVRRGDYAAGCAQPSPRCAWAPLRREGLVARTRSVAIR